MYGSNRLAFGILAMFVAGILFFFAFHPGGVKIHDPDMNDGKGGERPVRNPAEILGFLMTHEPEPGVSSNSQGIIPGEPILGGPLTGGN